MEVLAEATSIHYHSHIENMWEEPDTGQDRAVVMAAADEDCKMEGFVEVAPGPWTYSDNTSPVHPGSSLDNDRSPPLPVLEGPESLR